MGPVAQLMRRSLYAVLNAWDYWCQLLHLTPEAQAKLYMEGAMGSEDGLGVPGSHAT